MAIISYADFPKHLTRFQFIS
uniref:Uncharacterized protein n=1 Tax=Anguilla anguilla TaxID=7936 RepID=A0A0E9V143_ANGAN